MSFLSSSFPPVLEIGSGSCVRSGGTGWLGPKELRSVREPLRSRSRIACGGVGRGSSRKPGGRG